MVQSTELIQYIKVRCDLITSWNQEMKEIGWEKIGNNIVFQGHLCAVDSGLKRKNGCYIGWTGNCKEKNVIPREERYWCV